MNASMANVNHSLGSDGICLVMLWCIIMKAQWRSDIVHLVYTLIYSSRAARYSAAASDNVDADYGKSEAVRSAH